MNRTITELWYWRPAHSEVTLDSLFCNKDRLCFLAGSGISCNPPTCFPTGYQFTKALLQYVLPTEVRQDILDLTNPKREGMQSPGDFLRFERLLLHLQESCDPALQVLDGFAASERPNPIHVFLAKMIVEGNPVLTTNFDSLIEYALLNIGVPRKEVLPVISESDWEARPKRGQCPIYKLHGSIFDAHGEMHCRESLQVTLSQIAQGKGARFQLEPWKRQVLQFYLFRYDLVVLGYSGLDDFDVLPTLWNIRSAKRILWISHDSLRSPAQARIEVVDNDDSQAGLVANSKVDRIGQNLLEFIKHEARPPSQLFRIYANTGQLVDWLSKQYLGECSGTKRTVPNEGSEFSFPSYLKVSDFQRWLIAAEIFEDCHVLDQSLEAYATALIMLQSGSRREKGFMVSIFNAMGRLFHREKDYKGALENYQTAHRIAEELGVMDLKSQSLNNIGRLFCDQGGFEDALETYGQALSIAESMGNRQGKSTILNNIGVVLFEKGDLDKALDHYRRSLALADQLGNLKGMIAALNNIAMVFRRQSRLGESLWYYRQALQAARLLGNIEEEEVILHNISSILRKQASIG